MKFLKYFFGSLVVVIIAAGTAYKLYTHSKLPDLDGTVTVQGISSTARITRDTWGIPHISASSGEDAYFAYGFAIAQDRLFQMEMQRRLVKGELAEILGPKLVKTDSKFRTLMIRRRAEEYLSQPDRINPRALQFLDAFLAGINAFIMEGPIPVEFSLLGFKPDKFTRIDSVAMLGYMAYSFIDGIESDSIFSIIEKYNPSMNAAELFPGYSREKPVTIMETPVNHAGKNDGKISSGAVETNINSRRSLRDTILSYQNSENLSTRDIETLLFPTIDASNSWVVGPSRSVSGSAILANDPHVALANPGIWYEAHISYPGNENYGYFIGTIPFPMLAHNSSRAWAITMFENDDCDLFYETFHPAKKDLVMYRGRWVKAKTITESIKVKGGPDQALKIRVTPHGPVITDYIEGYKGKPVSMFWIHLDIDNPVLDAAYYMSIADNIRDFKKAISLIADPGFNVSYADSKGNIAWWSAGRVPIYPSHVNSKKILDGSSGRDEKTGYLPFEKNPHLVNPASGIIVTANNMSTLKPVGPLKELPGYWVPTDRASRIIELLRARKKWDLEGLKAVQTDLKSHSAPAIISEIAGILKELPDNNKEALTPLEKKALDILASWDGLNSMDSAGATIFHFLTYHIMHQALVDDIGEENFVRYCDVSDQWNFFKAFIRDNDSSLWDNIATEKKESRIHTVMAAFRSSVAELNERFGDITESWTWGRAHTIEYVHPVGMKKPLNHIFNIGPLPAPGSFRSINRFKSSFGKHDYRVKSIPSNRRLIDYANLEQSFFIQPSGNSGNFQSPHYDDQVSMYIAGKYRVVNFSTKQVEQSMKHELVLTPEK